MAILECTTCGGKNELPSGKSLGVCRFCGSQITLPRVTDENHVAAFNRGNHFRRIGEFDKALMVYERIVREDEGNAEAHWCCALCRFGIEYVQDAATGEYLPTCHRASYDNFLEDVDYLAALEHADGETRALYQQRAEQIAAVLRGVVAISQSADPFDVFLCYKETGADGQRTRDSQLAQDIYYQLTDRGLRVFFARITLEDKPGVAYEPYIFSALNSAKVMVVVGTKPEHLSAVWVRNEWSRFLALMKRDHARLLIPCYRDMDPYDMPDELSVLQSYDMSRIGFVQDLVRGIRKVVGEEKAAAPASAEPAQPAVPVAPATEPLLRRVALFLEDGDWRSADDYCEKVLDIDPECARAYVGKLMAALQVTRQEKLRDQPQPFDQNPNYIKAVRFADEALAAELRGMIAYINERNDRAAKDAAYRKAEAALKAAKSEPDFINVQRQFAALGNWRDAAEKASECAEKARESAEKAETARKEDIYASAMRGMQRKTCYIVDFEAAIRLLQTIPDWRDATRQIEICQQRIRDIEAAQAAERAAAEAAERRRKRNIGLGTAALCIVIAVVLLVTLVIIPNNRYNEAVALMDAGRYEEAIAAFEAMNGYKDSDTQIASCETAILDREYAAAVALMDAGQYEEAIAAFKALDGYKDSATLLTECLYIQAEKHLTDGETALAAINFYKLGNYRDAAARSTALWAEVAERNPIAAGFSHTVGLRADGSVVAVGDNGSGQCNVTGWSDVVSIAAGYKHTVGLRADGSVVAVGYNYYDQCDVTGWSDVVAIAAGYYHTVGLRADGSVVAVGYNGNGRCDVTGWSDVVAIAAGYYHTVGLRADGSVVAVGYNKYGPCDVTGWSDVVAIAAGDNHTVGLRADGSVVAVGKNNDGQCNVTGWTDVVAIAAGNFHTVGLRADGSVVAVGWNYSGRCDVTGWSDVVAIAAGGSHTVGLRADGSVVAVGDNDDGQCDVTGWKLKQVPRPTRPE